MRGEELVFLGWSDLAGITRGRGVPVAELDDRMTRGIGWPKARQALPPFGAVVDNPWQGAGETRMIPDPGTQLRIDLWPDQPPLNLMLCDAREADGTPWDGCVRAALGAALRDLEQEVGVQLLASFDLAFDLAGAAPPAGPAFSLEAFRSMPAFGTFVAGALRDAEMELETFDPDELPGRHAVSCRPAFGIAAADRNVAIKEVVREVARRMAFRASFAPAVESERPGWGAPIHLSLHRQNLPVGYDPARPGCLSEVAGSFAAGIVRHMPALCAFTAPSVVSYPDPGRHHEEPGYAVCATGERAALRICTGSAGIPLRAARQFRLEYRPADSTANPYLALAAIVRAGLQGIREGLSPLLLETEPEAIEADERHALGLRHLPRSLVEALQNLEGDAVARAWFPPALCDAYIAVKRAEIQILDGAPPQDVQERYRRAY